MVYAKKTDGDGNVLSLYTYDFDPDFGGDESMSIITKEEYDDILVMVSEIAYFLQNELGCVFPAYGIPQSGEFDF